MVRDIYLIPEELYQEALDYAKKSCVYTSDRHDFHDGGLENKRQKMFEGKLGEKAVKMMLKDNGISFKEDDSPADERDEFDFKLVKPGKRDLLIDVKTRTKDFYTRTLEMVEQYKTHPKHIYISARLYEGTRKVKLLGWYTDIDMLKKNQIENNGYLDNYVMYDEDLRPMEQFVWKCVNYRVNTMAKKDQAISQSS